MEEVCPKINKMNDIKEKYDYTMFQLKSKLTQTNLTNPTQ